MMPSDWIYRDLERIEAHREAEAEAMSRAYSSKGRR